MELLDLFKEQLSEIDVGQYVKEEIRLHISADIKRAMREIVDKELLKIITTEIDIYMSGEIITDDGWGHKEKYINFENLFKTTFKNKIDKSYDMKGLIEKHVKARVEQMFNANYTEIAKRMSADLIAKK